MLRLMTGDVFARQATGMLSAHEEVWGSDPVAVQIAGYILGEFGHLLAAQPSSGVSASAIFSLLHDKFPSAQ